ncbi:MAG TPA: ornithine carbamoyltransferase [Spirochaetota bacterium]|nr:MAG: Ornithine carbamoyltransferase, catabolic [Spirochaetes bacterium ADurb.Bin133]HNZ25623.1 ornithine carbamoyltransferase [Spirochaetota bacterium]HOF00287.1 ornithine carbamoyltransferase [Spirochaetota bacterium]HOS32110.1 ornithine carbamoyltransferase [Spirochaetota bacterium]HOS55451.1 ornithine carbamoyltransferase [Spirochaetota bacterium]
MKLGNKSFLSLYDLSKDEIDRLIDLSIELKAEKKNGIYKYRLKNKNIALLFEKTSTRTRCAASVACFDEGGHAEFLGKNDIQMGKKESVRDTARVLGKIFDSIIYRGYKQETVKILSEYSGIPVINGLTDEEHPTQIIADLMTIKEKFNKLEGLKVCYIGDARNNVACSLIVGCLKMNVDIFVAAPKSLWPSDSFIVSAKLLSKKAGLYLTEDPLEAVKNSNVVYTDVWVSMGEENAPDIDERIKLLKNYQVNKFVMDQTGLADSIFLHCLPASHEEESHYLEVSEEVFESKQSYVFEQAGNRLHTIKALLVTLLGGKV